MTTLLILTTAYMAEAGTGLYMGPYFKDPQPLNFTVHTNNVAYLPCAVRQLGDKKVMSNFKGDQCRSESLVSNR